MEQVNYVERSRRWEQGQRKLENHAFRIARNRISAPLLYALRGNSNLMLVAPQATKQCFIARGVFIFSGHPRTMNLIDHQVFQLSTPAEEQ